VSSNSWSVDAGVPLPAERDTLSSAVDRRILLSMVGAAFLFYMVTLAPGVMYGDAAKFQTMPWRLELAFDEMGHPIWVLFMYPIAHLPGFSPAFACNMASAFFSALALWPAWRIARRLGASRISSTLACLALAVSHTFWFHAVITEVYAVNDLAAFWLLDVATAVATGAGARRSLVFWGAIGVFAGLAGANHGLIMLWIPGLAWLLFEGVRRHHASWRGAVCAAAGFAAAVGTFSIFRILSTPGPGPLAVVAEILRSMLDLGGLVRDLAMAAGYLLYQFPLPVIIVAAWPGCRAIPSRLRWPLLLMLACSLGFAVRYPVKDRFAFFQPAWLLLALIAAPGLDAVRRWLERGFRIGRPVATALMAVACIAMPPVIYAAAVPLAKAGYIPLPQGLRDLPGRDEVAFFFFPGKRGETGHRRHAEALMDAAPPRTMWLADHSLRAAMEYLQFVEGRRPDVDFTWAPASGQVDLVERYLSQGRPVCLPATDEFYDMASLSSHFTIVEQGLITCLSERGATPQGPPVPSGSS